MGKFDGMLICSDMDHTLISDDKKISDENIRAAEYFMSEGGYFTFATGRSREGIGFWAEKITPNAPIILFNGAAIYDYKKGEFIWETFLNKEALDVMERVERECPFAAMEVFGEENIFVAKGNIHVKMHLDDEKIPYNYCELSEIKERWRKGLFLGDEEKMPYLRQFIAESDFFEKYNFVKSDPCYYEILPKEASKGNALKKLAQMLNVDKTVGIGDDENDLSMINAAKIGVAVANAVPEALRAANFISTDNNSHALSTVIYGIDKGIIDFGG